MGIPLTAHQQVHFRELAAIKNRLVVQLPAGLTEKQRASVGRGLDRRLGQLPGDVAMCLFALAQLAEAGNQLAAWMLEREVERLGLIKPFHSIPKLVPHG